MEICLLIKKIKIFTLHVKKQVTSIRKYVIKVKTIQYKNVKKLIKPLYLSLMRGNAQLSDQLKVHGVPL